MASINDYHTHLGVRTHQSRGDEKIGKQEEREFNCGARLINVRKPRETKVHGKDGISNQRVTNAKPCSCSHNGRVYSGGMRPMERLTA